MKANQMISQGRFLRAGAIVLCIMFSVLVRGVQSADAAVGSCPNANLSISYANGTVTLNGSDTSGNWYLCLYDPSGNRVTLGVQGNGSITASATAEGNWNGAIAIGHVCSNNFATAGDCATSVAVGGTGSGGTTGSTGGTGTGEINIANPIDTPDFTTLVQNVLSWLLSVVGGVALLFMIYGGVVYISSIGDQKKAEEGKKIVTAALLGLTIILLSYSILVVVERIFFAA